jgi:hypothetical protein
VLDEYPSLSAYIARGESRPGYARPVELLAQGAMRLTACCSCDHPCYVIYAKRPSELPSVVRALSKLDLMSQIRFYSSRLVGRAAVRSIACACMAVLPIAHTAESLPQPQGLGRHTQTVEDRRAIEEVLATYTRSVTNGDERSFEALLLDENVTFTSTDVLARTNVGATLPNLRHYRDFRHAVFESGQHLQQQFFNVKSQQDGPLAQVSCDFVTVQRDTQHGGYGWKVLQMLKVQGQWKIASELYTAYSLDETREQPPAPGLR